MHLELEATGLAIEAAFPPSEVDRMYAALPIGRFRGFDDIALTFAGRRYCSLNEGQKDAVREFGRYPVRRGCGRSLRRRARLDRCGPAAHCSAHVRPA